MNKQQTECVLLIDEPQPGRTWLVTLLFMLNDKQHREALNSLRHLCRVWEKFSPGYGFTDWELNIYHHCARRIRVRLKAWPRLKVSGKPRRP